MKRRSAIIAALLLTQCATGPRRSPVDYFDQADTLSTTTEMAKARDLYRQAASSDRDPDRRAKAIINAAVIGLACV
ncbi:MAG: hypothetical protein ABI718_03090 [Acidobacteriota bacterium]